MLNSLRQIGVLLVAMAVPIVCAAVSPARQEYLDAVRSRADVDLGARLFSGCVACHGPDGGGSVNGNVPRISGQHARVIIRQLVDYRYSKRWDPLMEHVANTFLLSDAKAIADVAGFIQSLEARAAAGTGDGAYLETGRQIYLAQCSSCHGRTGEGDDEALIPRLAGQHYAYLLRQFYDAVDGRRPNLSRTHLKLLRKVDRDALQGMADALSRAHSSTSEVVRGQ